MVDVTTALELLKTDIGIRNEARDVYLTKLLESVYTELSDHYGLTLDLGISADVMLVEDYAAWRYRSRTQEGAEMPKNIRQRIIDRKVKERAKYEESDSE